jgi:hypothetical protein
MLISFYCQYNSIAFQAPMLYKISMTRKNLSTRIDNDLQKSIKILAINLEKPLNDLLEEAIQDLLQKYENPKTKKK